MKKFVSLLTAGALALSLVGCSDSDEKASSSKSGSDEKVTLDFWVFGSTGYQKLIDEYQNDHPNVKIKLNEGEMNDMHNNLFTSISAGSGAPDIAMIEVSQMEKFKEASERFYNLNEYGAGDYEKNFLDWKWQQGQNVDGSFQMGFPTDIGPTALFYRKDVLDSAGLPTESEDLSAKLNTWEDFYDMAKTVKEKTGKPMSDSPELVFNALRDQQSEHYFNEKDELIIEESVKDAYDYTAKMIQEGLVGKNSLWTPEWGSAMAEGSYAMMPGAPAWMMGVVKGNAPEAGGKWSLTNIPEGAGNWGGSFLTVPKESKHPEEAVEFIAWLTSPESQLKSFNDMGLFPSTPDVYENEDFLATTDEYFSGQPTAKIFAEAAKSVKPVYMGKNYAIVNTEILTALTNVATKKADPEKEWTKAVERIEKQIGRQ
ncbi:ABC transporter substrate-binding protein [Mesobacillus subterraneus]|uniref:ABC transporter substrate-binding protein n=1 Tax=Mesobacillus subterraneus TaxID=285983 RepID=UPI001CFD24BC|nr:ABC transporter substrate-binding protein [Mesobacillus subterraneus]WLR57361.1 ABC transporter substrate-binding protein [Mesobacillus subterraneus]